MFWYIIYGGYFMDKNNFDIAKPLESC